MRRWMATGVFDFSVHNGAFWVRVRPYLPHVGLTLLGLQFALWMWMVTWELPSSGATGVLGHVLGLGSMAVAPGLALGYYVYYRDQYYDESFRLLGRIFLYAGVSGSLAGFVEWAFDVLISATSGWDVGAVFVYFFGVVALSEELVKFLVVYLLVYRSEMFKQVYDGILFCGASALGFATVENVLYVFTSGDDAIEVALVRAVMSVPGHLSYGLIMGYCMGRARAVRGKPAEKEWLVLGVGGAVILHGVYDFLLVVGPGILMGIFVDATGWYAAYRAMKAGLAYSPFTRCENCLEVMPGLVAFCPHCRSAHQIELTCSACQKPILRWSRKCPHCSTRVRLPWHLQIQRVKDLYPQRGYQICPSCDEVTPNGMAFCLHCGMRLNLPRKVIDEGA